MNELSIFNSLILTLCLLISGYFAGLVGMPLGPIRVFFLLIFGIDALVVFGTNLAISFIMMIVTVWNNFRNQRIDFQMGFLFIISGAVVGPFLGGLSSEAFSQDILLLIVTILIFISGALILQAVHFPSKKKVLNKTSIKKNIIASILNLFIGVLGGAVGMVLGALRYPVMINYLKTDAKSASATNSFINLIVAIFAFLGHLITSGFSGNSHFNPLLFLPLAIAGFIGSYFGSKHVGRYSNRFILKTLYVLLFIMGTLMLFRGIL